MRYREFAPGEDAGRFVDCFWVLEGAAPGAVQRVVPGADDLARHFLSHFSKTQPSRRG